MSKNDNNQSRFEISTKKEDKLKWLDLKHSAKVNNVPTTATTNIENKTYRQPKSEINQTTHRENERCSRTCNTKFG